MNLIAAVHSSPPQLDIVFLFNFSNCFYCGNSDLYYITLTRALYVDFTHSMLTTKILVSVPHHTVGPLPISPSFFSFLNISYEHQALAQSRWQANV